MRNENQISGHEARRDHGEFDQLFAELAAPADQRMMIAGLQMMSTRLQSTSYRRSMGVRF